MLRFHISILYPSYIHHISTIKSHQIHQILYWLVVRPPLWKIWVRQLGWLATQYEWENKKWQPNHQPAIVFLHEFRGQPMAPVALTCQSCATLPATMAESLAEAKCSWRRMKRSTSATATVTAKRRRSKKMSGKKWGEPNKWCGIDNRGWYLVTDG